MLAKFSRLQSLDLSANNLSGALAEAAEEGSGLFAVGLPDLRELNLAYNDLSAADAAALVVADFPRLETLDLSERHWGPQRVGGAAFLTALCRGSFPELRRLKLSDVHLKDAGASALALGRWPRLHSLVLSGNKDLSADGVLRLLKGGVQRAWPARLQGQHLPALRELDLRGTGCCRGDAATAAAAAIRPELSIIF